MQAIDALLELVLTAVNNDYISDIQLDNTIIRLVYHLACKQGVQAIVWDGLQRFVNNKQIKLSSIIDRELKLRWALGVDAIASHNNKQRIVIDDISRLLRDNGGKLIILKGLGLSRYYPKSNNRECGDIDIYCTKSTLLPNEFVLSDKDNCSYYKHTSYYYKGVCIEYHHYFTSFRGNKQLKWFERVLQKSISQNKIDYIESYPSYYVLSPTNNALFLAYHTMSHFLIEGISLRVLLDWGFFVSHEQDNVDWIFFYDVCERMHYSVFVNTINSLLAQRFHIIFSNNQIRYDDRYVEQIFQDILNSKREHASGLPVWKRRFVVLCNTINSRWKYSKILERNIVIEVFRSLFGLLFDRKAII